MYMAYRSMGWIDDGNSSHKALLDYLKTDNTGAFACVSLEENYQELGVNTFENHKYYDRQLEIVQSSEEEFGIFQW